MNFHLYLVLPQNIPEGETFFLVTAKYCLLYTQGEAPKGAKEIKKISTLPRLAKEWLAGCIDQIREKALEEQKDQLLNVTGPAFYAAFEEALKAERGRQGTGNREPGTGNEGNGFLGSARNDGDEGTDSSAHRAVGVHGPYGASAQNDKEEKEDGEA